jgi:hypothetical protein
MEVKRLSNLPETTELQSAWKCTADNLASDSGLFLGGWRGAALRQSLTVVAQVGLDLSILPIQAVIHAWITSMYHTFLRFYIFNHWIIVEIMRRLKCALIYKVAYLGQYVRLCNSHGSVKSFSIISLQYGNF